MLSNAPPTASSRVAIAALALLAFFLNATTADAYDKNDKTKRGYLDSEFPASEGFEDDGVVRWKVYFNEPLIENPAPGEIEDVSLTIITVVALDIEGKEVGEFRYRTFNNYQHLFTRFPDQTLPTPSEGEVVQEFPDRRLLARYLHDASTVDASQIISYHNRPVGGGQGSVECYLSQASVASAEAHAVIACKQPPGFHGPWPQACLTALEVVNSLRLRMTLACGSLDPEPMVCMPGTEESCSCKFNEVCGQPSSGTRLCLQGQWTDGCNGCPNEPPPNCECTPGTTDISNYCSTQGPCQDERGIRHCGGDRLWEDCLCESDVVVKECSPLGSLNENAACSHMECPDPSEDPLQVCVGERNPHFAGAWDTFWSDCWCPYSDNGQCHEDGALDASAFCDAQCPGSTGSRRCISDRDGNLSWSSCFCHDGGPTRDESSSMPPWMDGIYDEDYWGPGYFDDDECAIQDGCVTVAHGRRLCRDCIYRVTLYAVDDNGNEIVVGTSCEEWGPRHSCD